MKEGNKILIYAGLFSITVFLGFSILFIFLQPYAAWLFKSPPLDAMATWFLIWIIFGHKFRKKYESVKIK